MLDIGELECSKGSGLNLWQAVSQWLPFQGMGGDASGYRRAELIIKLSS